MAKAAKAKAAKAKAAKAKAKGKTAFSASRSSHPPAPGKSRSRDGRGPRREARDPRDAGVPASKEPEGINQKESERTRGIERDAEPHALRRLRACARR